jgi:hypothetical protein
MAATTQQLAKFGACYSGLTRVKRRCLHAGLGEALEVVLAPSQDTSPKIHFQVAKNAWPNGLLKLWSLSA